jgi:protein-S-isoprenylcysteine O-methyltransferase Ste14
VWNGESDDRKACLGRGGSEALGHYHVWGPARRAIQHPERKSDGASSLVVQASRSFGSLAPPIMTPVWRPPILRITLLLMKSPPIPLPPPILVLVLLILSALLASVVPIASFTIPFHGVIAALFILAGLGFSGAGFFTFKNRRTPVRPGAEPALLVLEGPYRITRNPMYLGLLLFSIGWFFAAQSLWFLLPPILFFLLINFRLIPFEEQLLKEHFGAEYETYCQRVRRWL